LSNVEKYNKRKLKEIEREFPHSIHLIQKFLNERISLSENTRKCYINSFLAFLRLENIPLEEYRKEDFIRILGKRKEQVEYSTMRKDYQKMRIFFRWLTNEDWKIKIQTKEKVITNNDLLTNEEIGKLINACKYTRDKALISLVSETGARINEILSLNIKNIQVKDNHIEINIPIESSESKVHHRVVFVVETQKYLIDWLNEHPCSKPNEPLFVTLSGEIKRLSYSSTNALLQRVRKKVKIGKKVYWHLFRHTRATEMAKDKSLTDRISIKLLGWKDSQMFKRYEHLASVDTRNAILEKYGIQEKEETQKESICPKCETPNPKYFNYCGKCRSSLSLKQVLQEQEESKTKDELIQNLLERVIKLESSK
jgi:integrase